MLKGITLAVAFTFTLQNVAYAAECTPGLWSRVLTNLEWTLSNEGARNCAFVKIQSGSRNAYEAFRDCNDSLRTGGLPDGTHNDYIDCAPQACNWFISKKLTPAC